MDPQIVQDNTPSELAQMVSQGATLLRIENESQQQLAIQKPRDERRVIEGAIQELDLSPKFAAKSFYSIPYRKGSQEIKVEGPSIQAAMSLARRWGNCSNGARVVDQSDEHVVVEGVFVDYETNVRTLRTVTVAKFAKNKNTQRYDRLPPDRMNMAILAGMSKAVRNAILATLPAGLVDTYYEHAKQLTASGGKPVPADKPLTPKQLEARLNKGIKHIMTTYKLTSEQVLPYVQGLKDRNIPVLDIITHLQGVCNAIEDGQITAHDAFGVSTAQPGAPEQGEVTADELFGDSKESTPKS